jgi:hypothetical protein
MKEEKFLDLIRQIIDDYEECFPQPYESDFESKKVVYDTSKLSGKISFDLYQERRRQKWNYYIRHPPNERMKNLVAKVEDIDDFSDGVALAYRLISDKFHKGFYKMMIIDPRKVFIYKRVVKSLQILLKNKIF